MQISSMQQNLLSYVAAALFDREIQTPETSTDWAALRLESVQQGVFPFVYSTVKQYLPEEEFRIWKMMFRQITLNNVRVEGEHVQLHTVMTAQGIPYVCMKGSTAAAYYPKSILRTLGDVDFLVEKEDLDRAGAVLEQLGFQRTEDHEHGFHIAYYRRIPGRAASTWEMHWEPNGVPDGEAGELLRGYFSEMIQQEHICETDGGTFMAPSAFHHGLILLTHTATHLINTGVGVRHLCDWAVFAGGMGDEEFSAVFEERLKACGLWRFAQLLTLLSVKYLGCPERSWAGEADEELLEAMMGDIFAGGNFGIKDAERINQAKLMTNKGKGSVDDTGMVRQFFRMMTEKAQISMPICKRIPFLIPIGWVYAGGRHLMRVLRGERPEIHMKEMVKGANERREIYKEFKLFEK